MHNFFTTNIPRFAPTLPGSGLVQGPSWKDNPDPGYNFKEKRWDDPGYLQNTIKRYNKHVHKKQSLIPAQNPPSIPTKKVPTSGYTGRNQDTVGPAVYNPKFDVTKLKSAQTDFGLDKQKREAFGIPE